MNANNSKLYESICKANINESIYIATEMILMDQERSYMILQNTLISVCSYIGSFVSLYEIRLWIDILSSVSELIEDDKIVIKDIYILITKMCVLCDIYIKNPKIKTGTLCIKQLREKMIDLFTVDNFKLTSSGTSKFDGILPPAESQTYNLALQIITGYVYTLNTIDKKSVDDTDVLSDIANKFRHSIDYIIRKRYTFETKFYESDSDAIWFIWGIVSLLFDDPIMDMIYQLFNFQYTKTVKKNRVGLLWGIGLVMVYLKKKDISRNWDKNEINIIMKIDEINLILYKDIKKELMSKNEYMRPPKENSPSGLEFIQKFRPTINETRANVSGMPNRKLEYSNDNQCDSAVIRSIKCVTR